jgi:hypothetical protein
MLTIPLACHMKAEEALDVKEWQVHSVTLADFSFCYWNADTVTLAAIQWLIELLLPQSERGESTTFS